MWGPSGVDNVSFSNNYDFDETTIIYNAGQEEAAQQLKIIFENAPVHEYNSEWTYYRSNADLMLILGKDYIQYIE